MTQLRCVHINQDFAMGGVTKALMLFDHPELRRFVRSRVAPINLRMVAPRFQEEVIINHASPNWAGLPFLFMLRLANRKSWLVHIEHSYTRSWEARHAPDKGRFRTMLKLAYSNFNEIVAVSEAQRDWLVEAGIVPAGKVRVIHPWSGTRALDELPAPEFAADKPLRLGAIGRFDKVKGFDNLIRAFGLLPQHKFELVLGGFGPETAELVRLADGLENIRFTGRVDDVPGFLSRCDAVVVPSRCESFGLVAAEARQAGRPILVADVDGLPEQAARGGLVADCTHPVKLARAIEKLAASPLHDLSREARISMAGAQTSRINAWLALFVRVQQNLARRGDALRGLAITSG